MQGMTREQLLCAAAALLETLVACSLVAFTQSPAEVAACGVAAICGLTAFAVALEVL